VGARGGAPGAGHPRRPWTLAARTVCSHHGPQRLGCLGTPYRAYILGDFGDIFADEGANFRLTTPRESVLGTGRAWEQFPGPWP
jgi:hypothetical protein